MKHFLCILVLFFATSCDFRNKDNESYKKQTTANEVRRKAASEIKAQIGLYPSGTMGQMMYDIEKLGLSFKCFKPVTIEEGREYLVKSTQIFLDIINSDEKIRPYLANYPFTAKNIQIEIFIHKPDWSELDKGQLSIISCSENKLSYDVDSPPNFPRFLTVYEETFEEALKRPKVKNPKFPYSKGRNIPLPKKAA